MCKSTWAKEINYTSELTYMCLKHSELLRCTTLRDATVVHVNGVHGQCTTCGTACSSSGNILFLTLPVVVALSTICFSLSITSSEKLPWPFNLKELHPYSPFYLFPSLYLLQSERIWFSLCLSLLDWKFLEGKGVVCLIHSRCLICICGMGEWDTQYVHLKQYLQEGRLPQESFILSPKC